MNFLASSLSRALYSFVSAQPEFCDLGGKYWLLEWKRKGKSQRPTSFCRDSHPQHDPRGLQNGDPLHMSALRAFKAGSPMMSAERAAVPMWDLAPALSARNSEIPTVRGPSQLPGTTLLP